MRKSAVVLIYGEGGHREQMKRLYANIAPRMSREQLIPIGICENSDRILGFFSYSQKSVRHKHNRMKTLVVLPISVLHSLFIVVKLAARYRIKGVISTGPGIAVVPSLFFKFAGAKIVFLESWSRFETASITGRIMYRFADRFYIQNESLKDKYPNAIYGGLL